jgi:hypothetical protein
VLRVSGVLKCFKEFRKTGRASAVLGRTIPISRHTKLPERFVSKQNFFQKKLVLPAVQKSYSYNNLAPTVPINFPSLVLFSFATLVPNSGSRMRNPLSLHDKLMKVGIGPPHHRLQGPVQIAKRNLTRN